MNNEKHEHFHSWLRWKKEKSKKYPSISNQKQVLVREYGGSLLENVSHASFRNQIDINRNDEIKRSPTVAIEGQSKSELQKNLFNELRKERNRLANERNVPAYIVFDNKTLMEMSETLPVSESEMLQITGVGSKKLQLYGAYFIAIVKKFKNDFNIDPKNKKDA